MENDVSVQNVYIMNDINVLLKKPGKITLMMTIGKYLHFSERYSYWLINWSTADERTNHCDFDAGEPTVMNMTPCGPTGNEVLRWILVSSKIYKRP